MIKEKLLYLIYDNRKLATKMSGNRKQKYHSFIQPREIEINYILDNVNMFFFVTSQQRQTNNFRINQFYHGTLEHWNIMVNICCCLNEKEMNKLPYPGVDKGKLTN